MDQRMTEQIIFQQVFFREKCCLDLTSGDLCLLSSNFIFREKHSWRSSLCMGMPRGEKKTNNNNKKRKCHDCLLCSLRNERKAWKMALLFFFPTTHFYALRKITGNQICQSFVDGCSVLEQNSRNIAKPSAQMSIF